MFEIFVSLLKASLFEYLPIGLMLIFVAFYRRSIKPLYAMMFLFAAINFSTMLLILSRVFFFGDFLWNWQGKILDFAWPWIVVYGFAWLTPKEVGLKLPIKTSDFVLAFSLGIIFALSAVSVSSIFGNPTAANFNFETTLFQFTMPGLAEEITTRGIFLAILDRYLGKDRRIGKVSFGWGIILVTAMFILGHFYQYDTKTNKIVWTVSSYDDYIRITIVALAAVLLGVIREKSNSIWPGVLLHNLMNGLSLTGEQLFFGR